MSMIVPLPASTQNLLDLNTHPGLMLDKYVESWDPSAPPEKRSERVQKPAVQKVVELSRQPPPGLDFPALLARRREVLTACDARLRVAVSAGPLTLHLARASALENAGVCLHPLYGFLYLPGSGLKGMARAYACEVWLPTQPDRTVAWRKVCDVFGWAPSPALKDLAKRFDVKLPEGASAGRIVFHDAWPEQWPALTADILNSHHNGYYQEDEPPGDWDSPVPVYFLSAAAGVRFTFPLARRRDDVPGELLDLADGWLCGAMEHLGAGAKTATGYGHFRVEGEPEELRAARRQGWEKVCKEGRRAECVCELKLLTPAFLAGASQRRQDDCTLRPATVRGLLRWWWRTFHAGYVEIDVLRRMEAAVWGDTAEGGALRLTVEPVSGQPTPQKCGFKQLTKNNHGKDVLRFSNQFAKQHKIVVKPNVTPGLGYASFGMDEMDAGKPDTRTQRWFAPPDSAWTVTLSARTSRFVIARDEKGRVTKANVLPASLVLDQARMALWWLCRLGGVGSKARNGFGSFADVEFDQFEGGRWKDHGGDFREACGQPRDQFRPEWVASPSLLQMRQLADSLSLTPWLEVPTDWDDPWRVLDGIGTAMQSFAQAPASTGHGKHCDAKRHLGLPRKIHKGPKTTELQGVHGDRHASPVWYHVTKGNRGLTVRVSAFPSAETRRPGVGPEEGWRQSRDLLAQLLNHLKDHL